MAKAPKEEASKAPGILPVPALVVAHHGATLFSAMREWKQRGRVPPVLLLTGTAGCGKRNMAYWLAEWILCEKSEFGASSRNDESEEDPFTANLFGEAPASPAPVATDGDPAPCGQCASCRRAIQGNWVDFTEILPEDSSESGTLSMSGTLKVDQFREIKRKLGFGAHEGAYRIVLIPNADRMTAQAANSLLKLLEEPPPGWLFFLTASDPTLVLPTILSRCQALRLKPFQPEELEALLDKEGVNPQRRKICADLAQGSWSKALTLSGDEMWEHRQAIFGFVKEPAASLSALVDWAAQEPYYFDLLVDQLEQIASELIRWTLSPQLAQPEAYTWINADGRNALVSHAKAVVKRQGSPARARELWLARAERLARSRHEALTPLNRKLLIQDLLLPWLEAM